MARSRKKLSIAKDQAGKDDKRLFNKKFRAKERQALHHGEDPPVSKHEAMNQYDICDYKFYMVKGQDGYERYKRK